MPKIGKGKDSYTKKELARLAALEMEYDTVVSALLSSPGNSALYRRLHEIEIRIVQITGEKIFDY